MKIHWKELIISLIISFLPAIIGSISMIGSIDGWYATLNKPWFTPPSWLFGPVWTTLYILMGVSLYFIWIAKNKQNEKNLGLFLFGVQLVLNGMWSPLFFFAQSITIALLVIIAMDIIVILTIVIFYEINKKSGYLLIPYISWLCIATLLNFSILVLN